MTQQFVPFGKVPRLNRDIIITEKIDGTNGCIVVSDDVGVYAQSKNRIITPEADNHGFARWVVENKDELAARLGVGRHFGEWWGPGIQRGYGKAAKTFSLFNVSRWAGLGTVFLVGGDLSVVPRLYEGPWRDAYAGMRWAPAVELDRLRQEGSFASPGFMRPEGIVVYHTAGRCLFKATLEGDEGHKGGDQ